MLSQALSPLGERAGERGGAGKKNQYRSALKLTLQRYF
jgi:hypothetical protein